MFLNRIDLALILSLPFLLFGCGSPNDTPTSESVAGNQTIEDGANPYEPGSLVGESIRNIPDTGLLNQFGTDFTFEDLPAKPTVLSFIYTRCPMSDMCPMIAYKMGVIQDRIKSTDNRGAHFVLVTFDPEYDTPSVLKKYAQERNLELSTFDLVTGPKSTIDSVMSHFKIVTRMPSHEHQSSGNQFSITHNLRTYILDSDQVVRFWYRGSDWKPKHLVKRIQSLR